MKTIKCEGLKKGELFNIKECVFGESINSVIRRRVRKMNEALEELGWKWEPKWPDACLRNGYDKIFIVLQSDTCPDGGYEQIKLVGSEGFTIWEKGDDCIPLLPWEEIERILEGMGYIFEEPIRRCYGSEGFKCHCVIRKKNTFPLKLEGFGWGETRREAVRNAVLKLREELKREEQAQ